MDHSSEDYELAYPPPELVGERLFTEYREPIGQVPMLFYFPGATDEERSLINYNGGKIS